VEGHEERFKHAASRRRSVPRPSGVIRVVRMVYVASPPCPTQIRANFFRTPHPRTDFFRRHRVRDGSRNRTGPGRVERMCRGVLAYRGRWVYCVQRGAVTGRERRLMHLEGRTGSDDPRGRTDESPPGGM
jgi:hypothetical protein